MRHSLENLKGWSGEKESASDTITMPTVLHLAAKPYRDDPAAKFGAMLPIGWHSTFFPRVGPNDASALSLTATTGFV